MEDDIFELEYSIYDCEDDDDAISVAINVARRFLREPDITASQIAGIGHALYALERLPLVTPGVHVQFGIVIHYKSEVSSPNNPKKTITLSDMEYIHFFISEDEFEISRGGSTDCGAGHDSYSLPGWYIGLDGSRRTHCQLYDIEDAISMFLKRESTEINVEDQSEIDCFYDEESLWLNYHPLNQKAKELLQKQELDANLSEDQLYILQLMEFGLENPEMSEKREEIRSSELMQKLEDKVIELLETRPEETMSYLIKERNLYLGAEDLIEGATEVLWQVIDMILIDLDCPTSDDKPLALLP